MLAYALDCYLKFMAWKNNERAMGGCGAGGGRGGLSNGRVDDYWIGLDWMRRTSKFPQPKTIVLCHFLTTFPIKHFFHCLYFHFQYFYCGPSMCAFITRALYHPKYKGEKVCECDHFSFSNAIVTGLTTNTIFGKSLHSSFKVPLRLFTEIVPWFVKSAIRCHCSHVPLEHLSLAMKEDNTEGIICPLLRFRWLTNFAWQNK